MKKTILSCLLVLTIEAAFAVPVDLDFSIQYKNKLYPLGSRAVIENSMRPAVYLDEQIAKNMLNNYSVHIEQVDDEDGIWFRFGKACELIFGVDEFKYRLDHAPSKQLKMEVFEDEWGDEECMLYMPH